MTYKTTKSKHSQFGLGFHSLSAVMGPFQIRRESQVAGSHLIHQAIDLDSSIYIATVKNITHIAVQLPIKPNRA